MHRHPHLQGRGPRIRRTPPDDIDVITFTSSSTANNFIMLYGKDILKNKIIASIGPITTETLLKAGIKVDIEAKRSDIPGLVGAIEEYFEDRKA